MRSIWFRTSFGALALALAAIIQCKSAASQTGSSVEPFRIIGNVYYVGGADVTSFLILTPAGDILIDGGYVSTAPLIEQNIRRLGFRLRAVKILLNTHAHFDHAGGLARLKRDTGAKFEAMAQDAPLLDHGGRGDFYFGDRLPFPPVHVDRILQDGDLVSLGGVTLRANLTAGHTKGCTTWTWTVRQNGREYHVVDVCSASVLPGYRLIGNPQYPQIARDYERSFQRLNALPCDVFLGAHGGFFSMQRKLEDLRKDSRRNPFIDREGYRRFVLEQESLFEQRLKSEDNKGR
ncbi:MAG TPA: subclass B3 metallo-beta-lactamase [Terriglobia bacterium]|nr:subclass B3 metallo-beta-lactamase [Terriglobia bacterium]